MSHDDRDVASGGAGANDRDWSQEQQPKRGTEYQRGCDDTREAIAALLTRIALERQAESTRLHSRQCHNYAAAEGYRAAAIIAARDIVRSGRF